MSDSPLTAARPTLLVMASTYPRWAGDPEPGFVHALSSRLTSDFEVHVVCPHAPGAPTETCLDGVYVHRFHYAPEELETLVQGGGILNNLRHAPWKWLLVPLLFAGLALKTWSLTRRLRPACIHAHWIIPQGLVITLLGRLRQQPPILLTSHGGDLFSLRGRLFETLKRTVVGRATTITVVSHAMVAEAVRLGANPERLHVVPMGVDFDGLFTSGPAEARRPGEILFVGRLVEKKGLHHLIKAMPAIIERVPAARLTIAGYGPEETPLRELAASLRLTGRIDFLGALPQGELSALYRRASVFVAPFIRARSGDQEGLPVALMEAIACGCPVVVGDLPAMDDLFDPAEADMRIDPNDVHSLVERVSTTLTNPETALRQAAGLRQRLAGRLNWSAIARRYGNLLDAMAKRSGTPGRP